MNDLDKEQKILQNWKFIKYNKNPLYPFLVVDNWYTPDEEKAVWSELELYSNIETKRAEDTIVARTSEGVPLGKSYRWYHNDYYTDKHYHKFPIEKNLYKVRTKEFHKELSFATPYYRNFPNSNKNTGLISYYEEGDEYKSHHDTFLWTHLIWFYKEPKKFIGGDFTIDEANVTIKCKHNRAIFFPCCYNHSVDKIKMTENMPFGHGRWTITHFYFHAPEGKVD